MVRKLSVGLAALLVMLAPYYGLAQEQSPARPETAVSKSAPLMAPGKHMPAGRSLPNTSAPLDTSKDQDISGRALRRLGPRSASRERSTDLPPALAPTPQSKRQ